MGEKDRYERYLKWYKNMTNVDEYTFYVHGYFIPWIDEQKEAGLISEGRWWIFWLELLLGHVNMRDVKNIEDHYYGDIDSEGRACGIGVIGYKNPRRKHEGTFFNNKIHGFCKNFS